MKTRFRIYESHLSFVLQFMSDFGLYGCGWIDLGEVWQRGTDVTQDDESGLSTHMEHARQGLLSSFNLSPYSRQSRMALEVDVAAHQILNRRRLLARDIHHELIIPEPAVPPEPLVPSVRELWEDERRRRVTRGLSPSPEIPKDLSERLRGPGGDWVSEARYWEEIKKRIEKERGVAPKQPDHNSPNEWEQWVMTTFESAEALWEPEYKTWKPTLKCTDAVDVTPMEINPFDQSSLNADETSSQEEVSIIEVDEALLSSQAMHHLVEVEEAAWENAGNGDGAGVQDDRQEGDDDAEGASPNDQVYDDEHDSKQGEEDSNMGRVICSSVRTSIIEFHSYRSWSHSRSPRKRQNPFAEAQPMR